MTEHDKTNRWTLGKNPRKDKETHADYKGSINIEGTEYWLDAWIKTNGSTGEKFFSGNVKRKDAQPLEPSAPKAAVPFDDIEDLPF